MKRLLLAVTLLALFMVMGATAFAAEVSIQKAVEIVPPRGDTQKPEICIAMQAVWDPVRKTWRRQIIPFNRATSAMITEDMKQRAANELVPDREGIRDWESWKFTIIYPSDGTKALSAKPETVVAEAPMALRAARPEAAPKVAAKAPAAEVDIKITSAPAPAAKKPAAKKAPKVSPLVAENADLKAKLDACEAGAKKLAEDKTALEANVQKLTGEKADLEKSKGECNTSLAEAKKKAARVESAEKDAEDARKALKESYSAIAFHCAWLLALLLGVALGAVAERRGIFRR